MLHIYCGDGKGKTTAAVGLALRCAGADKKVLFCQFMKDGTSSELKYLEMLPRITVRRGYIMPKFSFQMNEEERQKAKEGFNRELEKIKELALNYDLLVLDEIISCINVGFLSLESVTELLNSFKGEIALTGREPAQPLIDMADYVSEVKKIKHPFDKNVPARKGIEF